VLPAKIITSKLLSKKIISINDLRTPFGVNQQVLITLFFELRIYQVFQGKMIEWLELMENIIIPFQVSKGMIIHGSFTENSFDRFYLSKENVKWRP